MFFRKYFYLNFLCFAENEKKIEEIKNSNNSLTLRKGL